MKSALNGGLNLSVLDGWWAEAYNGTNGWAIPGDILFDHAMQDSRDAATLFDIIEHEVVPLFYQRDEHGIPRGWVQRIRASLRTNGPRFSAARMMLDYAARRLQPHHRRAEAAALQVGSASVLRRGCLSGDSDGRCLGRRGRDGHRHRVRGCGWCGRRRRTRRESRRGRTRTGGVDARRHTRVVSVRAWPWG